ncbi:MAG: phosphoribosylformylglycinamidine synthase subunit PurL [Firmicutes bacterium]|jgi:phosphoribosylformylglycinamidine synthase|nr:phosphoribosylformylglycinamidine synthase subunit PurL [Bacillota bacterium]HPU00656.1 phosphoribosylformylglycinamidine synthase subunit PurL [Bacillota bacterium]
MKSKDEQPWRELGLTGEEYERIKRELGREPNLVELNMYSVMWSEHCSYKHSRAALRRLPATGPRVLQGPGENAGVVDLGGGLAAAFKIESHNHPTAVEPFQGAATGAGGIIRDIVAMGARPVALLGSLRFGPLEDGRSRYLFERAAAGMAWYARETGIPVAGGDIYFEESYRGNPLVNVMCVGLLPVERLVRGRASGEGNLVLLAGAPTGRDGIHGASFASVELTAEIEEEERPPVQVGDAALGKALMEATLEVIEKGLVVGVQDLGGAGLSCASTETAARAGSGMELDLDLVPLREEGMAAYEILTSESQERMLLIVEPEKQAEVAAAFTRRGLYCEAIGRVAGDGMVTVKHHGETVARVPAKSVAEGAPVYDPASREPSYFRELASFDPLELPREEDFNGALLKILSSPDVAGRAWMAHCAGGQGVEADEGAALLPLPQGRAMVVAVAGNGRQVFLDPYRGAVFAVCEAARLLACAGAEPLGITDGLNFGSPEKPEVYWQFKQAVEGIADACRTLSLPVVGGNVSFYNEVDGEAIYPTPVIGAVGLLEDAAKRCGTGFSEDGDLLYLLGADSVTLGGSQYLKSCRGRVAGALPTIDLDLERRLLELLRRLTGEGLLRCARALSEGGLAAALAKCCLRGRRGAAVKLPATERPELSLFGEGPTRVIVAVSPESAARLEALAREAAVPAVILGQAGGEKLRIAAGARELVDLPLAQLEKAYREAIPCPTP